MSRVDIIRAWKDEEYRNSLSEAERNALPEHPAGLVEISDADVDGGLGLTFDLNPLAGCSCCCSTGQCTTMGGIQKFGIFSGSSLKIGF